MEFVPYFVLYKLYVWISIVFVVCLNLYESFRESMYVLVCVSVFAYVYVADVILEVRICLFNKITFKLQISLHPCTAASRRNTRREQN